MSEANKNCFGILDKVFPMGDRGLREVAPACFECHERVTCLRAALATEEGLELQSDNLERASAGGFMGRLQRWSRKKTLSRLKEQEKNKKR